MTHDTDGSDFFRFRQAHIVATREREREREASSRAARGSPETSEGLGSDYLAVEAFVPVRRVMPRDLFPLGMVPPRSRSSRACEALFTFESSSLHKHPHIQGLAFLLRFLVQKSGYERRAAKRSSSGRAFLLLRQETRFVTFGTLFSPCFSWGAKGAHALYNQ